MVTARRIRVTGRVQGVFFRAWTKSLADGLGVTGWIRNCADGSVEAHVEGDEAAVLDLIERMRDGASGSRVDRLQENATQSTGGQLFEVRH